MKIRMRALGLMLAVLTVTGAVAFVVVPWAPISTAALAVAVVGLGAAVTVRPRSSSDAVLPVPEDRAARAFMWCGIVAMIAFVLAEMAVMVRAGKSDVPLATHDLTLADAVVLLAQGLIVVALALVARPERERDVSARLDASIIVLVAALLAWPLVFEPAIRHPDVDAGWAALVVSHTLVDIALIGLVLRLVFTASADTFSRRLMLAGVVGLTGADLIVRWQMVNGAPARGTWLDAVRLLGIVAIGAAVVDAPRPARSPPTVDNTARWRLVVVLTAVLVPQSIVIVEFATRDVTGSQTVRIAGGVATATVALVAIRMWNLVAQTRRMEARRGAERFSALIHHSSDAIFLIDSHNIISYASPSVQPILGRSPQQCIGESLVDHLSADGRGGLGPLLRNIVDLPEGTSIPVDGHFTHTSGAPRSFEGTVRNLLADSNVRALVVTLRDITARRELEAQLERRAFHDELTGLANRSLFSDRVGHALVRGPRHRAGCIAVLFIDLDDFKAVNDGMGHGAGDELLCQVAERIRVCLRPGDSVARLGGDEFAVLLEDVPSVDRALHVAGRILEMLQLPMRVLDVELAVPASIGIALSDNSSVEDLLRDADMAMYSAKARGKGCVAVFDEALRSLAEQRLELKVKLPEALRAGQFRVVYQPIQDVKNQELHGFEALIRWDHPERGVVAPDDFIHVAEETGLIIDIGRWVLEEAARQAVIWNLRSDRRLTMNVNVSAVQLHHLGFVDDVRSILATTGMPADLLTIEITESVLVEHERVETILQQFRDMGINIAIDDFGTGYSSLAYLQRFPVSSVKVDKAFVAQLADGNDPALVRSILAVADALSLTTVAEGVETKEQLRVLNTLDCRLAQGFFLHEPQPPHEIDALLLSLSQEAPQLAAAAD